VRANLTKEVASAQLHVLARGNVSSVTDVAAAGEQHRGSIPVSAAIVKIPV
jgi:hypothetical protein